MRQAIRSEHSDFFKKLINNNCLHDSPLAKSGPSIENIHHDKSTKFERLNFDF